MSKQDERLARVEESLSWIKREISAIRAKLEKIPRSQANTRLLTVFLAAIITWLSVLTYLTFSLSSKKPYPRLPGKAVSSKAVPSPSFLAHKSRIKPLLD